MVHWTSAHFCNISDTFDCVSCNARLAFPLIGKSGCGGVEGGGRAFRLTGIACAEATDGGPGCRGGRCCGYLGTVPLVVAHNARNMVKIDDLSMMNDKGCVLLV